MWTKIRLIILLFLIPIVSFAERLSYSCEYSSRIVDEESTFIKSKNPEMYLFLDLNSGKTLTNMLTFEEYTCKKDNWVIKCENVYEDTKKYNKDFISIGRKDLTFNRNLIIGEFLNNKESTELIVEYKGKCRINDEES